MAMLLEEPVVRAWLVASAWAEARRDRCEVQQSLLEAIWSPAQDQVKALEKAGPDLPGLDLNSWCRALGGEADLEAVAADATLGGCQLSRLSAAASLEDRRVAMDLLVDVLNEKRPELAKVVGLAASSHVIDQLVALWLAWTGDLDPFGFAFVALTRARLLGGIDHGEHFFVAMRYQGLA